MQTFRVKNKIAYSNKKLKRSQSTNVNKFKNKQMNKIYRNKNEKLMQNIFYVNKKHKYEIYNKSFPHSNNKILNQRLILRK